MDTKNRKRKTSRNSSSITVEKKKIRVQGSSSSSFLKKRRCDYNNSTTYFSEDVWFEILLRLPLKSIFKFRSVSKQWLSLISSPLFKTRRINCTTPPPSTIFFQYDFLKDQHHYSKTLSIPEDLSVIQSISTDEESSPNTKNHSQFTSHDGFSFRFLLEDKAFSSKQQQQIYLLASSNGLVLCSTSKYEQRRYIVCNPLTKKWVFLPQPKNLHRFAITGFTCESTSSSSTSLTYSMASYKVMCIYEPFRDPTTNFHIEIFSSDTGKWNTYNVSCPQSITMLTFGLTNNVVANNGVLYWIEGLHRVVVYDLKRDKNGTGQFRLINLPKAKSGEKFKWSGCLGESEGLIHYCEIHMANLISKKNLIVWELVDDYLNGGRSVWHLVHKIELKDMSIENESDVSFLNQAPHSLFSLRPLAFNPGDRNAVILGSYKCIAAYNIRTRRLKVLRRLPFHCISPSGTWSYWTNRVLPFVLTLWPTALSPPP